MNGNLILLALLPTISQTLKDELLAAMTNVSRHAFSSEPGVRQFALLEPRNEPDSHSLYSMERYTDEAAFQSHLSTPAVRDMFSWIQAAPIYQTDPTVHQLFPLYASAASSAESDRLLEFTRPALASTLDPFVVVRQISYAGGESAVRASLSFWASLLDRAASAADVLSLSILGSTNRPGSVFTLSVYADEAAYGRSTVAAGGTDEISSAPPVFLKLRGGFLFKP